MFNESYKRQVQLLLSVLPEVAKVEKLALHGGTAINLFERDLPRLSVDIDLTYLPLEGWETANKGIQNILGKLKESIPKTLKGVSVQTIPNKARIDVFNDQAKIKIEITPIIKGTIDDCRILPLCERAQNVFDAFCEMKIIPHAQLFGSKICAALDRQHPRDLFDVKLLLEETGITPEIIRGFIFNLVSHGRPICELIAPNMADQSIAHEKRFLGMTDVDFTYKDFEESRITLVNEIRSNISTASKEFLIGFDNGEPNWDIYDFSQFPSVQYKLQNLQKFKAANPQKHGEQHKKLKTVLKSKCSD